MTDAPRTLINAVTRAPTVARGALLILLLP